MTEKMVVFEDKDGKIYEVPASVLAPYLASPERVLAIRVEQANGSALPASAPEIKPMLSQTSSPAPSTSPVLPQPIVLNIFVGGSGGPVQVQQTQQSASAGVAGYHMAFDENGIPHMHHEWLWGDYIDKQGKPAVGYHSHDPVTGNAQ